MFLLLVTYSNSEKYVRIVSLWSIVECWPTRATSREHKSLQSARPEDAQMFQLAYLFYYFILIIALDTSYIAMVKVIRERDFYVIECCATCDENAYS
uniref:G_PROTEIN_RECEP_F1_2 domain-containing protein n=1 Tax=Steinernema glaseri TaxID=37863 RepID=A0A1I7YFH1_9BILA